MYKYFLRPLFFLFPAETAHGITMSLLKFVLLIPGMSWLLRKMFSGTDQPVVLAGLKFPNPVGMAAGFDKNGTYIHALAALGFGFVEVGTVTPLPQPGNEKPRLFRLPADKALINRMGFNNDGAEMIAARLRNRPKGIVVGGNIGKNKVTSNDEAGLDYEKCFRALFNVVDYFVVNVSSPNTPGLRALQEKEPLMKILSRLTEVRKELLREGVKPVFLKIAPDLGPGQLEEIIAVIRDCGIDGIVACNTTLSREHLCSSAREIEMAGAGGCSGMPLQGRACEMVRTIVEKSGGSIPVMGVGGIFSAQSATAMKKAGAGVVQLYTGFIYEGPSLVKRIKKAWAMNL